MTFLSAVRDLAVRQNRSIGKVRSDLARQTLPLTAKAPTLTRSVPLHPVKPDAKPVTLQMVKRLG